MKDLKTTLLKAGIIILGLSPIISNAQWTYSGTSPNQNINSSGNGNVGIGNNVFTPSTPLEVNCNGNGWLQRVKGVVTSDGQIAGIQLATGYAADAGKWAGIAAVGIGSYGNSPGLVLYSAQTERVRIDGSGNVGIGTTSPRTKLDINGPVIIGTKTPNGVAAGTGYMLAVSGTIYAQEVDVTPAATAWSDYVFKSDYKLAPLTDVAKYIEENGHLKDVPSAEEVGKSGYKVGEMDATLLRKIEELTLYMLAQQKEIEGLKAQINK